MSRILWTTDIHLNFAEDDVVEEFLGRLKRARADVLLCSGDIGESTDVIPYLVRLADNLSCPVYFVLGNHDFYFGSIAAVRNQVQQVCEAHPSLHYLTLSDMFSLTDQVAVVGHDGWADGRSGDYERSEIMMNDYQLIEELAPFDKQQRWDALKTLGDQAAAHLLRVLPLALEQHAHVYLVTHVPPLREACWYNGEISNDEWAPHFTCLAMGEAILEVMSRYPERQLTVLCGHTHGAGKTEPLPNVTILTGGAEYGNPAINEIFDVD
ncbi:MAG: metallophosphoesterase [Pirellulaceae bacterium]